MITSTRRVDEGGHLYYHDGKCIMDLSGRYDNNVQLFRDCSSSIKVDGTRYDGKYCEAPVESPLTVGETSASSGGMFCFSLQLQ